MSTTEVNEQQEQGKVDGKMEGKIERSTAPRDVKYSIEIVDELPESSGGGGGGRSMLEDQLAEIRQLTTDGKIKRGEKGYPWVKIGDYRVNSACTSAALALRKRHGDEPVEGWSFASRKLEDGRQGLFVRYNPEAVVEGARKVWDEKVAKREAANQAKLEEKKAKAAKESEAAAASASTSDNARSGGKQQGTQPAAKKS